jgi:hypothetical protein
MYGLHEILLLYSTLTRGKLIQKCFEGEKIITNTNFFKGMTKRRKKNNRSRPTVIFFSKIKKSVLCDFKHNISNDHVSVCVTVNMAERDEINFSNSLKERKKSHYTHCFSKCVSYVCVCVSVSCKSDFLFLNEAHWNSSSELSSIVFSV